MKVLDISEDGGVRIECQEATKVMLNLRTRKGFIRVVNASTGETIHEIASKRITLPMIRTLKTMQGY